MTCPLKIGVVLPVGETHMNGQTPRWADLLAMAQAAEQVGFDSIWIADHYLYHPPVEPDQSSEVQGMWECTTLLAAFAAVTNRVELGALVICTGFRNPALLAKIADTIDEISGGRFILGLGAGWHEPEYDAMGIPFDHRVSRFEEAIQIIAPLLKTRKVDFDGRYYRADDCERRPRGPRSSGPPLLFGTTGERMLGLTARYADIWNVSPGRSKNDLAQVQEYLAMVDAACEREDRDPATLQRSCAVKIEVGPYDPYELPYPNISGTPDEIASVLRDYVEAGIDQVQVILEPCNQDGIESFAAILGELDR